MNELKRTPLYQSHLDADARMVDFGGWSLPVAYGSQIEEHKAVRRAVGMFDVSHMTIIDVGGDRVRPYLRWLLANDVAKLGAPANGVCKALYTCMLDEAGGILDDLIVYRLGQASFRLIVNAATREKGLAWLNGHAADYSVEVVERTELAMVAVQGPRAGATVGPLLANGAAVASLAPFTARCDNDWFVARTGYTGEDGIEIMLPGARASALWTDLRARSAVACGLGARDTLRTEAGYSLYGHELTAETTPIEASLGWAVALDKPDFIGRETLAAQKQNGVSRRCIGFKMTSKSAPPREHYKIFAADGTGREIGEVTSGVQSPSLGCGIGLGYVESAHAKPGTDIEIEIRNRRFLAQVVKRPIFRKLD